MALHQVGDPVHLTLLASIAVTLRHGSDRGDVGLTGGCQHRGQLTKEHLETCRRDNLENASRSVCRVPEGVWYSARLQHVRAWSHGQLLFADPSADLALEDVGKLVFPFMNVRDYERAGLDGMLYD